MTRHPHSLFQTIGIAACAALLAACGSSSAPVDAGDRIDPPGTGSGEPGGFHTILPPGQRGVFNATQALQANAGMPPTHTVDQLALFDSLVRDNVVPGFSDAQLDDYFIRTQIAIDPQDVAREYRPGGRDDVIVRRDASFGVPYIEATTREGAAFASGYVAAEDRLFLMDVLRHVGSARMAEFLGPSESNIAMDRSILDVAPYRDADYATVFADIANAGPAGERALAEYAVYIDGINTYIAEARMDPAKLPAEYPALQKTPEDWSPDDVAKLAALIGAFFGKGGGNELRNFCALQTMQDAVGDAQTARAIFDDLMLLDDPESAVTTTTPFPYQTNLGATDPASLPAIDCASLVPIDENGPGVEPGLDGVFDALDNITGTSRAMGQMAVDAGPLGQLTFNLPNSMSNGLLLRADRTASGRPVAVMGPQLAFFMPQIFTEKSIIAPGIRARGAGFPGTDLYIEIGRGEDYAWSATTSRADLIDHFVLLLCDPEGGVVTMDSMGYQHNGTCKPIEEFIHTETAVPTAGGAGAPQVLQFRIQRTPDYGPLIARGALQDGTPIAVASHRSTYFRELRSIVAFALINDPDFMADGPEPFREAMSRLDYVFNWLYIDRDNIAYQHSCLCPTRAAGTDPLLPTLGDGRFDWDGFLGKDENPHVVNPASGYISSWNSKQAPAWGTADDNPWWGPGFRGRFFEDGIAQAFASGDAITRGRVLDIVQGAATKDLRGDQLVPLLARVMDGDPPGGTDARAPQMLSLLEEWFDAGAHRIDRDNDGAYEQPQAPAIMDAWWPRLIETVFDARTGDFFTNLGLPLHQAPQLGQGFAFGTGPYSHFNKDLRQVLGDPVTAPFSRTYCGDGDRDDCAAELWASLSQAAADLEAEFSSATVSDWQRTVEDDAIRHSAAGVVSVPPIPFQNRPTYQLVVEVE